MNVVNTLVYRIIPLEKSKELKIGDIISIPEERIDFHGSHDKIQTEDCFEEIRGADFPHLPSRKSSLFVLPYDEEIAKRWVEVNHAHDNFEYVLCTLHIIGELIWSDENLFTQAGVISKERSLLARQYWECAGDLYEFFELPEGLFRGKAILQEMKVEHFDTKTP